MKGSETTKACSAPTGHAPRSCPHVDRLIIREDEDLRGRQPGEIAERICRTVYQLAPDRDCRIIIAEPEALRRALDEMAEGEVVFFFFEKQTEPHLEILKRYGARPADVIEPLPAPQPV